MFIYLLTQTKILIQKTKTKQKTNPLHTEWPLGKQFLWHDQSHRKLRNQRIPKALKRRPGKAAPLVRINALRRLHEHERFKTYVFLFIYFIFYTNEQDGHKVGESIAGVAFDTGYLSFPLRPSLTVLDGTTVLPSLGCLRFP